MKASQAFFRSAEAVTAILSTRITTDGHDRYPRAIRSARGPACEAPTSRYLNNRLEQDHRRIKGRYRPMRGFKCAKSAAKFCQKYDEFRNFVRPILPSAAVDPGQLPPPVHLLRRYRGDQHPPGGVVPS